MCITVMTELEKAFNEIKIDNIKSIDQEIKELNDRIFSLRAKRSSLMVGDLDLVGKYYRVTNFGSSYVFYVHPESVTATETGAYILGETYIVLDSPEQMSVEYLKRGKHQYSLDPDIHSNIFEEISEEEFVSEIKEVVERLNNEIVKSRK